jgi:large subunit ribosomal protein L35
MPKQKTHKGIAKRFKLTKTGKLMFSHQNQQHHKLVRNKRRTRRGKEPGVLTGVFAKKLKRALSA